MSLLLSPVEIGSLSLANRVVMSPMCMYEVVKEDGVATPFHFAHYGARAIGQTGLIIIEATGVEPDGRISSRDLGLWNQEQKVALERLVADLHSFGTKVGIQLNHAGRKAKDAVYPLAPSEIAYSDDYATPNQLTIEEIHRVQASFVAAAKRSVDAGIDMIQLHGAHGYLINQFLSPSTNQRTDKYGGTLENRYRFLQEIVEQVRKNYHGSLWVRLSLTDYAQAGEQNSLEDWQEIGRWLETEGVDCLDISTGGLLNRRPNIPMHDGYQVPFSIAMKQAVSIPVTALGLLDNPGLCEYILQNKQADIIMQGRALIRNVNWLADAAISLHDQDFQVYNDSYKRGQL
ncbi:NADH:flavin oxidoreductase/NADH oxidase [Candidatus Enterococcus ferrettii]|uniref:NADPH2 dehydrogenase n=1 Tax=Candidatus Enterococcus ferrettii TaxID=2815324 RepID=A0ABV0EU89_9ENTE|nr:NADH:flavin oxidoreductase/NADH oxidase [Enterococcus sp. 665A]MBO1341745.1 NADH:flavin oxidoreductase/NADH oxidase [Enterococcus sp. 665A]